MRCKVCEGADRLSARVLKHENEKVSVFREDANYCPRCGRKLRKGAKDELRPQG